MRRLTPLVLMAVLATGCSSSDAAPAALSMTAAAPTPGLGASTSPSIEATEAVHTAAEEKYLAALTVALAEYLEAGETIASDSYVRQGHEICGQGDYSEPPTIDAILEHIEAEAEEYGAAIKYLCPKYLPIWRKAQGGFTDGTYEVGKEIKPGRYRTAGRVSDCYWERSTGGGDTIANDFVTNAPRGVTVTTRKGEGFKSEGCGSWIRA